MSRRYAANVDKNQASIVKALREIAGVSVEVNHGDFLVGRANRTYWFELKSDRAVSKKTGEVFEHEKKDSQKKLEHEWQGHYEIVSNIDQILKTIMGE